MTILRIVISLLIAPLGAMVVTIFSMVWDRGSLPLNQAFFTAPLVILVIGWLIGLVIVLPLMVFWPQLRQPTKFKAAAFGVLIGWLPAVFTRIESGNWDHWQALLFITLAGAASGLLYSIAATKIQTDEIQTNVSYVPAASKESLAIPTELSRNEIPEEHTAKLRPDELVHHFAYIDAVGGGCANPSSSAKQWILVTNQRIVFEASIKEGVRKGFKYVQQSGAIPLSKVSYVGAATSETSEGCSQTKTTSLRINSSGSEILLAIPTQQEAVRIQEVIDELISKSR